jgi:peptidoglycan-associated lipoprotein
MQLNRMITWVVSSVTVLLLSGCGPDYPKCDNDDHCAEKGQADGRLFCVNGLCQQCRENSECGDDSLECNAGVCEAIPGFCSATTQCPGNQKCRGNRCGAECESADECGDGKDCQGGACVAPSECSADTDCGDGKECDGGRCVAAGQCSLSNVYFGYDDASVDGPSRGTLQANADCVKERQLKITITGHCDERGTSEYNIALGERRAMNASKYLQTLGVEKKAVNTLSYGEERLIKECGEEGPESCHRSNRRAEFTIR